MARAAVALTVTVFPASFFSIRGRSAVFSRAGPFVSRNVTVPISCINGFIMMWTTTSAYMGIAVAMKMWTLRQVSSGPLWLCVGGVAPFL